MKHLRGSEYFPYPLYIDFIRQCNDYKSGFKEYSESVNAVLMGRTTYTFTFSHLADTFIQSDLQLGNT